MLSHLCHQWGRRVLDSFAPKTRVFHCFPTSKIIRAPMKYDKLSSSTPDHPDGKSLPSLVHRAVLSSNEVRITSSWPTGSGVWRRVKTWIEVE